MSDHMVATKISELHFVVSTDIEKPKPELRKFIRSHVMLGKNRGKILPPRKRKHKGVRDASHSKVNFLCINPPGPDEPSATSNTIFRPASSSTIPSKFGSDIATLGFPSTIEPEAVEVILRFSSIAKKLLFSLETCILFERRAEDWIAPLAHDPAYLHCMIFTSQYLFDAILSQKSSSFNQRMLPHFLKTVKILRERLENADDQARLSDTTSRAVLGLAGHALLTGDVRSARHHIEGLRRIVSLRGGVETFKSNAKLLLEILRCDLGISLRCGLDPIFFNTPSSERFLPYPDLMLLLNPPQPTAKTHPPLDGINPQLYQAWKVLSDFYSVINIAIDSKQFISTETFFETMASVTYRLLALRFDSGIRDEVVRLGLLAFSCSVFLQWRNLGVIYSYFRSEFQSCLVNLIRSDISPQLQLWLLMVGAVSVFDETDDGWLKPLLLDYIKLNEIESWTQMQDLLESFLWIGLVHDKPGKGLFDSTVIGLGSTQFTLGSSRL